MDNNPQNENDPGPELPLVNDSYLNTAPHVRLYEHAFYVKPAPRGTPPIPPDPPKRGAVTTFSRGSRCRLIKTFMKLRSSELCAPWFLTLTFHHWDEGERERAHVYLNTFLTNLRRDYPAALYLWRLELQKRGAPHYHVIIWLPAWEKEPDDEGFQSWIKATWHRIADPDSKDHAKHGTRVDRATSYRKAFQYLTKYTAKRGLGCDEGYPGRRWARSRQLPIDSITDFEITDEAAHYLKRILRKLVRKRTNGLSRMADYMRRPQSCLISLDLDDIMALLDCLARAGPVALPGYDPLASIEERQAILDNRKKLQRVAFRRFTTVERSATSPAPPSQETPGQGVPS